MEPVPKVAVQVHVRLYQVDVMEPSLCGILDRKHPQLLSNQSKPK